MKKNLFALFMIAILFTAFFVPSVNNVAEAASESDPVAIITDGNFDAQSKELTVVATIPRNSGLAGLTLTLVYDKDVLTYKGYDYDPSTYALGTLDLMSTGTEVATDTVKFNWLSKEGELVNDNRAGTLLTLHFSVKENTQPTTTTVGFKSNEGDAFYLSGTKRTNKKISIASFEKEVYNSSEEVVPGTDDNGQTDDDTDALGLNTTQRIVILCGIAVAVVAVVIVFIAIGNKRKNKSSNEVNRERCQEDSEVNQ